MINLSSLMNYAPETTIRKSERIVEEARARGDQTAFLSHSHADATYAKHVQAFLKAKGWRVYIDWEDATMPPKPDKET
jgi:nicotinamidase-related amidase